MQRILGFREHRAVGRPGRSDGFDREEDGPLGVDRDVGDRSEGQLACRGEPRLRAGALGQGAGQDRERRRDQRRDGQHGDERPEARSRSALQLRLVLEASSLGGRLGVAAFDTGLEVGTVGRCRS